MLVVVELYNTQWKVFTESSPIEVYRASIEIDWPAFPTQDGRSSAKHKVSSHCKSPAGFPGVKRFGLAFLPATWSPFPFLSTKPPGNPAGLFTVAGRVGYHFQAFCEGVLLLISKGTCM
jgi:hypothetical protein